MSRFDLVIFDNDGVLVDSETIANQALAEMLNGYGLDVTWHDCVERYLGSTLGRVRDLVEEELGHPVPADFEARYRATVYPRLAESVQPIPGVVDVLDRLDAAGVTACVASSGIHERIRITLTTTGLVDRFEGRMFSAQDVGHGKPAPDLFLYAAASMGVAPERCAVVEDAPAGIAAADAAAMTVFGYAALTPRWLLEGASGGVVDDMAQLPGLLLGP
ncbi:MAG TPA: HAD-IA family hydrolase [Acidimicrobiales bacterium]|nr:HAD-IA family hydrolase [Acidimicrobiales bacterium]